MTIMKILLTILTLASFLITSVIGPMPQARADEFRLPAPGTMVNLSPAYEPVVIKGLTVHKDNPFAFDFIIDPGQDKLAGESLKREGEKLIKYFLASLAIPDKDLWVNLSPYEKDRIISEVLAQTDMGRDLLEQDYILKQITASLIYPEKKLGKMFWDKVYTKAQRMYGTTKVPVNTFNKVWIMADKAEIFEHNQTVFVVGSHLKVMLEEDYLALSKNVTLTKGHVSKGDLASQIVRAIILPELEKEVNTGKNFANVRQIFNSIILAGWFKKNLKKALLNQVYSDKSKVKGIDLQDKTVMEQIYHRYLQAYKKGVFNYIKEEALSVPGMSSKEQGRLPRKYFSGGITPGKALDAKRTDAAALVSSLPKDRAMIVFATEFFTKDEAMTTRKAILLTVIVSVALSWGLGQISEQPWFYRDIDKIIQWYNAVHVNVLDQGVDPTGIPYVKVIMHGSQKLNTLELMNRLNLPMVVCYKYLGNGAWVSMGKDEQLPRNEQFVIMVPGGNEDYKKLLEALGIHSEPKKPKDETPPIPKPKNEPTERAINQNPTKDISEDAAMAIQRNGGIDLQTQNMDWDVRKEGNGVEIQIDPLMVERIKREGIESLRPVIYRMTPLMNVQALID